MRDLRIPLDAGDSAIQDALMKLFNAQVRDESGSDAGEGRLVGQRVQIQIRSSKHQIQF